MVVPASTSLQPELWDFGIIWAGGDLWEPKPILMLQEKGLRLRPRARIHSRANSHEELS